MLVAFNPALSTPLLDGKGNLRDPHVMVVKGCRDRSEVSKSKRSFLISLEVEEKLIEPLNKVYGILKITGNPIHLLGHGMEELRAKRNKEALDSLIDHDVNH